MYQDVMECGLEFLFYYIKRGLKTKLYLTKPIFGALYFAHNIKQYCSFPNVTASNDASFRVFSLYCSFFTTHSNNTFI